MKKNQNLVHSTVQKWMTPMDGINNNNLGDLHFKTVKTNDKIRHFEVVMTPLSRNDENKIMQITAIKAILAREININ